MMRKHMVNMQGLRVDAYIASEVETRIAELEAELRIQNDAVEVLTDSLNNQTDKLVTERSTRVSDELLDDLLDFYNTEMSETMGVLYDDAKKGYDKVKTILAKRKE